MTDIIDTLRAAEIIGEVRRLRKEIERLRRLLSAKVTPGYELLASQIEDDDAEIERLRAAIKDCSDGGPCAKAALNIQQPTGKRDGNAEEPQKSRPANRAD